MFPERLIAGAVIAVPYLVGIVDQLLFLRSLCPKKKNVAAFFEAFSSWANSRGNNIKAYNDLLRLQNKVQSESGQFGVINRYHIPGTNLVANNYQVFLNLPAALQRLLNSSGLYLYERDIANLYSDMHATCVRYETAIDDAAQDVRSKMLNPIRMFTLGVQKILAAPLSLLADIGLIGSGFAQGVARSRLFQIVSALGSLVGFIASVATLLVGWDEALSVLGMS